MKPLGYYGSSTEASELFDELMLRYGPTLERLTKTDKLWLLIVCTKYLTFDSPFRVMAINSLKSNQLLEMEARIYGSSKSTLLSLIQALTDYIQEDHRLERVDADVAIAAKNPL